MRLKSLHGQLLGAACLDQLLPACELFSAVCNGGVNKVPHPSLSFSWLQVTGAAPTLQHRHCVRAPTTASAPIAGAIIAASGEGALWHGECSKEWCVVVTTTF